MSISSSVSRVGIEKEIKEAHDGDIMRPLFVSSWEVLRVLKMKINLFLLANYVLWKQAICQTLKQAFSLEMHGKLFVACTHFGTSENVPQNDGCIVICVRDELFSAFASVYDMCNVH